MISVALMVPNGVGYNNLFPSDALLSAQSLRADDHLYDHEVKGQRRLKTDTYAAYTAETSALNNAKDKLKSTPAYKSAAAAVEKVAGSAMRCDMVHCTLCRQPSCDCHISNVDDIVHHIILERPVRRESCSNSAYLLDPLPILGLEQERPAYKSRNE